MKNLSPLPFVFLALLSLRASAVTVEPSCEGETKVSFEMKRGTYSLEGALRASPFYPEVGLAAGVAYIVGPRALVVRGRLGWDAVAVARNADDFNRASDRIKLLREEWKRNGANSPIAQRRFKYIPRVSAEEFFKQEENIAIAEMDRLEAERVSAEAYRGSFWIAVMTPLNMDVSSWIEFRLPETYPVHKLAAWRWSDVRVPDDNALYVCPDGSISGTIGKSRDIFVAGPKAAPSADKLPAMGAVFERK